MQFGRHKLRTRVDVLKGMSEPAWETLLVAVLSRPGMNALEEARWDKGRMAVWQRGVEWLKGTLVKEGEELLERYDQLLPPEHRK